VSDVILDDGSEQVTVQCNNLHVQGHDFLLDAPARRKPNSPAFRRALVHDQNDGLTLNFGGDYPGGVKINGWSPTSTIAGGITLDVDPLVVTGDIHFTIPVQVDAAGNPRVDAEEVNLGDVITSLRSQIAALQAQVAQLAQRP
jgi:hypothetical protein